MHIDLSGMNVLVTGASRGIGAAIASQLYDAGARVGLHFGSNRSDAENLAERLGDRATVFQANLAHPGDCQQLWDAALGSLGHLDILVNNAGIAYSSSLEADDADWLKDWDATMAVNLRSAAHLCKLAIPHFIGRANGRIINISSRAAFRGDQPEYLAYAASKGGLVALTRSIARGYGKAGVKAFNVAPGFVRTEMAQDFIDRYGDDYASNDIALPNLTEPADVAPMVALLASGLADHATGCTIDINAASYVH